MTDLIAAALVLLGAGTLLLASIGALRMPDLPTRLSASSKAITLGAGSLFVAVAVASGEPSVIVRAAVGIVFIVPTAPLAAHRLARAWLRSDGRFWPGTHVNELPGRGGAAAPRPDRSVGRAGQYDGDR